MLAGPGHTWIWSASLSATLWARPPPEMAPLMAAREGALVGDLEKRTQSGCWASGWQVSIDQTKGTPKKHIDDDIRRAH